jgi:hypothetical protein
MSALAVRPPGGGRPAPDGGGVDDAEPDALEIVQFARYLGMDPIEDCAFLWIAEQALVAPLPDDWSEHMDAEGNVYYYNVVTDESSWEHPMDQYYRNLFLKVQREHEEKKKAEEEERKKEEAERQEREKAARVMEEERLLARERAALLIQRNYRGRLGRKKYLAHLEQMDNQQRHKAATKVQAAFRGHRVRKYVRQYKDEVTAAVREEAVTTIQARFRGNAGRRKAKRHQEIRHARKREHAATKIQSHYRRRVAQKHTHGRRCERAATRIQAGYRGSRSRKHTSKLRHEKLRHESAIRIQSNFRMCYQRKLYLRAKTFVIGITRIQALFRGRMERKRFRVALQDHRHEQRVKAATKIQARQRGRQDRKRVEELRVLQERHRAAHFIQCQWRHKKIKHKRHHAAIRIQKHHRGRKARRHFHEKKRDKRLQEISEHRSARCIQGNYRQYIIRRDRERARRHGAATQIQCSWRGKLGRNKAKQAKEDAIVARAAINVQSSFRGLLGRFRATQKRLQNFSDSIAKVVPTKIEREKEEGPKRGPQRLKDQGDQLEKDLHVKAVWLVVDHDDKDVENAHYMFLRGKPLASLQYLAKSLSNQKRMTGMRLSLVAAFTNYATLMSKIGQHDHSRRLVKYALRLLRHYISDEGELIKGKSVNEKISLDGDGSDDPRFVSIRSSAAVVLHNVAVEQLVLAPIPNFGEAVGKAGEALLAAQHSLGAHHPWRQQVENTHHVIIQLCKKGKNLDLRRALKTQIKTLKHDTSKRDYNATRKSDNSGAASSILSGGDRSPGENAHEHLGAAGQYDSEESEIGAEQSSSRGAPAGGGGGAGAGRIGSLAAPLSQTQPKRGGAAKRAPKREKEDTGPPVSRSFDSMRSGTPDSDTGSEFSGAGGLSREERVKRELERIQQGRVAKASKEGVKGIEVRRKQRGGGDGGVRPSGKQPRAPGGAQNRAAKIDSSALDDAIAQVPSEAAEMMGRMGTPEEDSSSSERRAPRERQRSKKKGRTPRAASSGRAQSKSRPRPSAAAAAGEAWGEQPARSKSAGASARPGSNPPMGGVTTRGGGKGRKGRKSSGATSLPRLSGSGAVGATPRSPPDGPTDKRRASRRAKKDRKYVLRIQFCSTCAPLASQAPLLIAGATASSSPTNVVLLCCCCCCCCCCCPCVLTASTGR